jgi:hypothetical protein
MSNTDILLISYRKNQSLADLHKTRCNVNEQSHNSPPPFPGPSSVQNKQIAEVLLFQYISSSIT